MGATGWYLKRISDFMFLLCEDADRTRKDILQRRFKKDMDAHWALFDIIEKMDELGYDMGVEFAFSGKRPRMKHIAGTPLSLIEIRVVGTLWRVITYWDKGRKAFVMLDAFEAHQHASMAEEVKKVSHRVELAKELLKEMD